MAEPQGLQRLGDVTFRDVGKGVARYKGPIALFLAVALMATILPNRGQSSDVESSVASGSGLSPTGAAAAADGATTDAPAADAATTPDAGAAAPVAAAGAARAGGKGGPTA